MESRIELNAGSPSSRRGLTVVIPLVNKIDDAIDCLGRLEKEREDTDLEVLLVSQIGNDVAPRVRGEWFRTAAQFGGTDCIDTRKLDRMEGLQVSG
jgi:hypothetical protein